MTCTFLEWDVVNMNNSENKTLAFKRKQFTIFLKMGKKECMNLNI